MNRKLIAAGALVAGYGWLRREALRGGATDEEAREPLPGDELVPPAAIQTTHAITIAAPPSAVWPWLMQAGFRGAGRAGWYSDSWLDWLAEATLFKLTVPSDKLPRQRAQKSARELMPNVPAPTIGGIVPDGPPGSAWFVVKELVEEQHYVLYSDTHAKFLAPSAFRGTPLEISGEFTWVFVLRGTQDHRTRLLLRTRMVVRPALYRALLPPLLYVGEAIIPHAILGGIKERVERVVASTASA
jgi:hypothetical protein